MAAVRGRLFATGISDALDDVVASYARLTGNSSPCYAYQDDYVDDLSRDPTAVGRVFLLGLDRDPEPDHVVASPG